MRYFVTIGERVLEVELGNGQLTVDGRPVEAELRAVPGTPLRHLLADGRSFTLVAEAGAESGRWELMVDGRPVSADVVDERTRAIRAMAGRGKAAAGPRPVRAPMPGLVLRIEVEVGQRIEPGQGVVVVEAMKMENELKAESAGTVSAIRVKPGQPVEKGTVLVEMAAP